MGDAWRDDVFSHCYDKQPWLSKTQSNTGRTESEGDYITRSIIVLILDQGVWTVPSFILWVSAIFT